MRDRKTQLPHVSMSVIKSQHSEFCDFTGKKIGKQFVTGYLGGGMWQLKCSCGSYSARKSSAIINNKGYDVCCWCRNKLMITRESCKSPLSADAFIEKYA